MSDSSPPLTLLGRLLRCSPAARYLLAPSLAFAAIGAIGVDQNRPEIFGLWLVAVAVGVICVPILFWAIRGANSLTRLVFLLFGAGLLIATAVGLIQSPELEVRRLLNGLTIGMVAGWPLEYVVHRKTWLGFLLLAEERVDNKPAVDVLRELIRRYALR